MSKPRTSGSRKATAQMIDQDTWVSIRLLHLRQGKSKSWLAREFGISRNTVAKYLANPEAPRYRTVKPRGKPILSKWEEHVRDILAEDRNAPRKQKHTARRVFSRLVEEHGYDGSERTIRSLVANIRHQPLQTATLPLEFAPGMDAQVDFGESYVDVAGVRTKLYGFEMRLNYSRKKFCMFVPAANTESFLEAHLRAFVYFGGVPNRLTYDNLGLAVIKVGKGKERKLTKKFLELQGFYAFAVNFCKPGIEGAHEKGGVESGIGFSRRNWMVPVPQVASIDELNAIIWNRCNADGKRIVAGQTLSIDEAFELERGKLLSLPKRKFDAGVPRGSSIADTYQTIAFENNRYSVPTKALGKPLRIRAYFEKVVIACGQEIVAEHQREYSRDKYCLKIEHYLEQLERKPHAVPFAKPVKMAKLPDEYWKFYDCVVEQRGASQGGRDFVRLLRAHCRYGQQTVKSANPPSPWSSLNIRRCLVIRWRCLTQPFIKHF
ncbi:MAG: IS21 family transposase [Cyanobacteria bacterium SZAS-4]|nr:IS21 family transposase [Cyanobacteria bacterium SZAS-4]